jgi:hypothetical protein
VVSDLDVGLAVLAPAVAVVVDPVVATDPAADFWKGNHGGYCEIKRVKDIKDTAEIIGALGGLEVDLVRLGNAPRRAPT